MFLPFHRKEKDTRIERNRHADHGEILLVRHGINQNAKETSVSTHGDIMENASASQPRSPISLPPALRPIKCVLFSKLREELVCSLLVTEKSNREWIHVLRDTATTYER